MTYRLFAFTPERSAPFLERLEWSTDIQTARSGKEFRKRLRALPRYRYEYSLDVHALSSNGHGRILDDLRAYAGTWLLPLWPHASDAPALPTRTLANDSRCLAFFRDGTAVEFTGPAPANATAVTPAALGRLIEARRVQHTTSELANVKVGLALLNHAEVVAPYTNIANGLAVFDFGTDWTDGSDETITPEENVIDYGGIWDAEMRFLTRTVSLDVCLESDAAIATFRSFLFHVQGSLKSFIAHPAQDTAPGTWRLNSDAVEILYIQPGLATARLTLKEVV